MRKLFAVAAMLLLPTGVLADTDAEDALAMFIIMKGHGCPDVTNVQPMGNDTYRVTCAATSKYPGSYNNGTYIVSLSGGSVTVTKVR